jgi:hypothetical protein
MKLTQLIFRLISCKNITTKTYVRVLIDYFKIQVYEEEEEEED